MPTTNQARAPVPLPKEPVDPRVQHIQYKCSQCGEPNYKASLTGKRVVFVTLGNPFRNLRSRTVDWLCAKCLAEDEVWNSPSRKGAPGMANTKLAKGDSEQKSEPEK